MLMCIGKDFTLIFYPVALLLSSLFLLLTIISYLLEPDLHRYQPELARSLLLDILFTVVIK
jgi:hypothetical protein